jgi:beta-glucosidase
MCCADAEKELQKDDVLKMLQQGVVKRWELQRNAADILQFILKTPAMETLLHPEKKAARQEMTGNVAAAGQVNVFHVIPKEQPEIIFNGEAARDLWETDENWGIQVNKEGDYNLELVYRTESVEQAQIAVSVYIDNIYRKMISLRGTNGRQVQIREFLLMLSEGNHYVRLAHREKDVAVSRLCIYGQRKR